MLPVAVEVAPPTAPREQVATLLSACSKAVANAECVLASEAPDAGSQAVAIVTWQSDGRATVEVGLRKDGKPEWRSRTVTFSAADEPIERWRTVGFVVGTLARADTPGEAAASDAEAAPAPSPPAPAPSPPAPAPSPAPTEAPRANAPNHPAQAAVELGAVMGPGLSGLRTGGVLRTRWPLYDALRSVLAFKYVARPTDDEGLRGQWFTAAAGLGAAFGSARTEVAATIDARAEYFRASAENAEGSSASQGRWLSGLALGVSGAWMPTYSFGFYLGAETAWMLGRTELKVIERAPGEGGAELSNRILGEDGALRVAVDGGIRLRLW